MQLQIDLKCRKIIPLNDDTPQDKVSFTFFVKNDDTQEFVLLNTPNGGFLIERFELIDAIENSKQLSYIIQEEKKDNDVV